MWRKYRCEAATVRGSRCRREATEYRNIKLGGAMREVLICAEHKELIRTGAFRLAR